MKREEEEGYISFQGVTTRRRVAQIRVEMRSVGSYISDSL